MIAAAAMETRNYLWEGKNHHIAACNPVEGSSPKPDSILFVSVEQSLIKAIF